MNSKRYQLLFMSVMGIVWSVYELGIRIVSYFKVLNSETINITHGFHTHYWNQFYLYSYF